MVSDEALARPVVRRIDHSHPALTKLARDAVPADGLEHVRSGRRVRVTRWRRDTRGVVEWKDRRDLQEALCALVRREQRLDFLAQRARPQTLPSGAASLRD